MKKYNYEAAFILHDGTFDSCGYFEDLESLKAFMEKQGIKKYTWRKI